MNTPTATPKNFAAFIGIDWADKEHEIWLCAADGSPAKPSTLPQNPLAIQEWISQLRQQFGSQPVALAIELSRGPLLAALIGVEFLVIYPINPKSLARYRQAFRPSGAKDDRSDAELLCDFVRHYHLQLKAWQPEDAQTRLLGGLAEVRRHWVDEVTGAVERLRANLKHYYPVILQLFTESLAQPMVVHFLQRWPTLKSLQQADEQELRKFFYGHNSRSAQLLKQRLELIRQAKPLTEDSAVLGIYQTDTRVISQMLSVLLKQIQQIQKELTQLFSAHPDAFIFQSLPGAAQVLGPRLLSACGTQRDRFETSVALAQLSGIAPITVQSGHSEYQRLRFAAPHFMHQTFWEFAKCSLQQCLWAKSFVDRKLKQGMGFNAAVRALAFKWIRIIWRLWQNREAYDESKYLAGLQRAKSASVPPQTAPISSLDSALL
jgi:transposase